MDWNKFKELTILIVDDDQFTRELIKTMLKRVKTITVHLAEDGIEALNLIEKHHYDMFLVDLYMPRMNGKALVHAVKEDEKLKLPPIVLITTDRLNKEELQDIGTNYYLTKPFDFQNFLKSIHSFFEEEVLLNAT